MRLFFWRKPTPPRCPHFDVMRVRSGWGYHCLTCDQPVRMVELYLTAREQIMVAWAGWRIR